MTKLVKENPLVTIMAGPAQSQKRCFGRERRSNRQAAPASLLIYRGEGSHLFETALAKCRLV